LEVGVMVGCLLRDGLEVESGTLGKCWSLWVAGG